jgi:hypothetical protein
MIAGMIAFFIRDTPSGVILFEGRLLEPKSCKR